MASEITPHEFPGNKFGSRKSLPDIQVDGILDERHGTICEQQLHPAGVFAASGHVDLSVGVVRKATRAGCFGHAHAGASTNAIRHAGVWCCVVLVEASFGILQHAPLVAAWNPDHFTHEQGYRILIALFSSQNPFEDIIAPFLPGVFCLESSTFSLKCPA